MLTKAKSPGPGSYASVTSISPQGKHFLSKFENSKASHFDPPTSVRFKAVGKIQNAVPGPGKYSTISTITQNGKYFLTQFKSSMCRTFGNEQRPEINNNLPHLSIPY